MTRRVVDDGPALEPDRNRLDGPGAPHESPPQPVPARKAAKLRSWTSGCLGTVGVFSLIAFAYSGSPTAAALLTSVFVLSFAAAIFGRSVPTAPRPFRARAERLGRAAAFAFAALLGYLAIDLGAKQREKEHAERLAALPATVEQMQQQVEAGEWRAAAALYSQIEEIAPRHPSLAAWDEIGPEIERLEAEAAETRRLALLEPALVAARDVVDDADRCQTPKTIAEVWSKLRVVRRTDEQWNEAQLLAGQLERCRKQIEASLDQGIRDLMRDQRVEAAAKLERNMLDKGFSATVTAEGRNRDRMMVEYVLITKALTHNLTDGGSMQQGAFLERVQAIGFRKVTFSDGYQGTWAYTLEPQEESMAGRQVLESLGIAEPLRLS